MRRNQKLTRVIGGQTVQRATAEVGKLVIRFDDQSTMQVKTAGVTNIFPPGGRISLLFEDGPPMNLQLADPGASVAVRDWNNQVEYLG